ncbi:MFS transporter [Pseudaestuariivita sp.]|uniref:MFS transporter n=1 Tax=Pseudaestuariivita sp. TaxID=2211669 RepID=UPI0040591D1C
MTELSRIITVLSAANFVIGMGAFMVVGLIEPVARDLAISDAAAGTMLTSYALGYAVLSPLLVALTGKAGRRRVIAAGLTIFALAAIVASLSTGLAGMSAARVLAAAGAGIVTPVASAVAAGLAPPQDRAKVLAYVFFGLTLAQVLGVPAGSWMGYTFGWQVAFWIVALLAVPTVWLVWTQVPAGLRFQPVTLGDLGQSLGNLPMMGATLFTGSFLGAIYVLYTYLAPLLSELMGFGRDGITIVLLTFGGAAVAGNLIGGWMGDRLGLGRTLTLVCIAQVALMPLFSALPFAPWLVVLLTFVWSLCGWSFAAPQQARLVQLAGPRAPVVLALNAAAIYIGAALGSVIGAAVLQALGPGALGASAGGMALLALIHLRLSLARPPVPA